MDSLFHTEPDRPASTTFVRVAVQRRVEIRDPASDGLTYAANETVDVGQLVTVPLGRGNTAVEGIVVATGGAELLDGFDPKKVKSIRKASGRPLTPELVQLGIWIARYTMSPLGMTLSSMVPSAVKQETGRRTEIRLVPTINPADPLPEDLKLTPSARSAWDRLKALDPSPFPTTARHLADLIESRTVAPINRLLRAGLLEESSHTSVRARDLETDTIFDADTDLTLTDEQSGVVEHIGGTFDSFAQHLLFGITGSGKTEVYLSLIQRVLDRGQTALMLVPEIALTPQTAGRVQSRLGADRVAVLHSGLTAAQRNAAWSRVAEGTCPVVVGARSAVFAPLTNLGLIVVDEEHDSSYKQDRLPRYNARDVAIKRAQLNTCPVVLGSATPSLESWANAQSGRSTLHKLIRRATGGRLPAVHIVDLFQERQRWARLHDARPPAELLLGPTLEAELERTLEAGGQALLLLNRRGLAGYVGCPKCAWALMCNHCAVRMVIHRFESIPQGGYVRCHHCSAEQILPKVCPDCQTKLRTFGAGTQRAEEVVLRSTQNMPESCRLVAGETLVRVDADTMRTGRDYFETLARFAKGHIRILLGTQMIAKGLDVANVRLVGVLSADTALNLPDFRAGERTFQLVSQVAGRAGRAQHAGTVIVQTYEPETPAIALAAAHNYERFATDELAMRRAVGLPPARRLVRIICRDKDLNSARRAAESIARAAGDLVESKLIRLSGPMPCPIERIADHFRIAVEFTAKDSASLQRALHTLRSRGVLLSDAKTAVDVDPIALL